ncbi:beta-ketoacyl synthase [Xylariaceae sp. FL1272]|nr:beta-ketoacyl synthase [Xylariaceae sp. FL1272]
MSANKVSDKSCVLFGPVITSWTPESLREVQLSLETNPQLEFLRQSLVDLPSLLPDLQSEDILPLVAKLNHLQELADFALGRDLPDVKKLSNVHLAPLTIVSHAVDFVQSVTLSKSTTTDKDCDFPRLRDTQGFCLGFLSAAALASSRSWAELEQHISTSIRIASYIGAVIEAQLQDETRSLSIRWKTDAARVEAEACLDSFSEAFTSCVTDERSATVTLPTTSVKQYLAQLDRIGVTAHDIGLAGSYHCKRHEKAVGILSRHFNNDTKLQLPNADNRLYPLRSNSDAQEIAHRSLHEVAVHDILCNRSHWYQVVKNCLSAGGPDIQPLLIGRGSFVPRTLATRKTNTHVSSHDAVSQSDSSDERWSDEIAVIGMSCRYPSADSPSEFWDMLCEGKTGIGKIPFSRFNPSECKDRVKDLQYWGNFLQDDVVSTFDNKFFGLSSREAKSMDPQQRLALQVAYEALESSGYYRDGPRSRDVGCYLGVLSVDYEDNIASEDATAFSALGTLRAFVSGRLSHQFGLTGPSLTVDTACSSAAVAIHTACQSLLSKDCSMALAGGVNVITSPSMFQNLAGASFLSPTGASKAFDAAANGYCRGEGAGILVLKRLSTAKADGDVILGVIAGSAMNQGENSCAIQVPHSGSQHKLYQRALQRGRINAKDVTYVEAHGTGTAVGDPIEYETVKKTFDCPGAQDELYLGSVKDNFGHTESASGVAGVLKCLLMMENGMIPKQAGFSRLNPKIDPLKRIVIPQSNIDWRTPHVSLIANYGAAGSNAAIVMRGNKKADLAPSLDSKSGQVYPIMLSAKSEDSLSMYLAALKKWIGAKGESIANVAFNLARRQNTDFKCRVAVTASSGSDLVKKLDSVASSAQKHEIDEKRPIIMCFGGQNGRTATLSRKLYQSSTLLRSHMDRCDEAVQSLGLSSLFPGVFEDCPIDDIVSLHSRLFSIQYATAMAWIDSGIEVDTLLGHSFGQLTALAVSGSLSLTEALKVVTGRAALLQEKCTDDPGQMISLECDTDDLETVVDSVKSKPGCTIEVACFNCPTCFVLGGDTPSAKALQQECETRGLKTREVGNTHAYHTRIIDAILPDLREILKTVTIKQPKIRVETCSDGDSWSSVTADLIASHSRQPVFFNDAVQRIHQRSKSSIWLEAGSNSFIVPMVRRALAQSDKSTNLFLPLDLSDEAAEAHLAEATCELWNAGSSAQFWEFHKSQNEQWTYESVPHYQFEKTRHWIDYKPDSAIDKAASVADISIPKSLVTKISGSWDTPNALFEVNTSHMSFQLALNGHSIKNEGTCPASMYIELVVAAIQSLTGGKSQKSLPRIEDVFMGTPFKSCSVGASRLRLSLVKQQNATWSFRFLADAGSTAHAGGVIRQVPIEDGITAERLRLVKRLTGNAVAGHLKGSHESSVAGSMLYKLLSEIVEYAPYYRGVQSVASWDFDAVGSVSLSHNFTKSDSGTCDSIAIENFLAVAAFQINCLSQHRSINEALRCVHIEEVVFTPPFLSASDENKSWTVYSKYETGDDKGSIITDIFVFDPRSRNVVLIVMGANFQSVQKPKQAMRPIAESEVFADIPEGDSEGFSDDQSPNETVVGEQDPPEQTARSSSPTLKSVQELLSEVMEIPTADVLPTSTFDELGVDSLMVTEVIAETNKRFSVSLTAAEFDALNDVQSLCNQLDGTDDNTPPSESFVVQSSASFGEVCQKKFLKNRDVGRYVDETGFTNFFRAVYPIQMELVIAYIVEAFACLGCSPAELHEGQKAVPFDFVPKHRKLVSELYEILVDHGIYDLENGEYVRTAKPIPAESSSALYEQLLRFPVHEAETKLLHCTGHRLAACLSGAADPISILFKDAATRLLWEKVYTDSPMFKMCTLLFAEYLVDVVEASDPDQEIKILELGAGTGGTTGHLVERLAQTGRKFTYTFTDLSPSLVAAARRRFSKYPFMKFEVINMEKEPEQRLHGAFDIIFGASCIHATRNLGVSTGNIRKMLQPSGILCLLELTRNLPWFSLVFGLLEGWWLFEDNRQHVLVPETHWQGELRKVGYQFVDWSCSPQKESEIYRVIVASPMKAIDAYEVPALKG